MKKLLLSAVALFSACLLTAAPSVTITVDAVTNITITCSFAKNADCVSYSILAVESGSMEQWQVNIMDLVEVCGIEYSANTAYTWTGRVPNKEYVIYAVAKSSSGQRVLCTDTVATEKGGGHGASVITVSVSNITDGSVIATAIPNDQTMMFKDMIIPSSLSDSIKSYFIVTDSINADSLTNDSITKLLKDEDYEQYEADTWKWNDLEPETDYLFVAVGMNADSVWGALASTPFQTLGKRAPVENLEMNTIFVYPNPASEYVFVNGVETGEMISVVDLRGNVIIEQKATSSDARISLVGVVPGVYIVRTATFVNKFIVR